MGSCLTLSTLAGIGEVSLRRVLGTDQLLQTRVETAQLEVTETTVSRTIQPLAC